jgi:hypothetical protein
LQNETKDFWSQIGIEMTEDEKTRAMAMPDKIERRKCVEQEHRFRRGVYNPNDAQHPHIGDSKDTLNEV